MVAGRRKVVRQRGAAAPPGSRADWERGLLTKHLSFLGDGPPQVVKEIHPPAGEREVRCILLPSPPQEDVWRKQKPVVASDQAVLSVA
jgi:hypothetical protein